MSDPTLEIVCKDGNAQKVRFKIKKTTELGRVMKAYAAKQGVDQKVLRFLFDGNPVRAEDTAKTLEMEDGDEIDVFMEQQGGSSC